jgi:hypothetical protein
VSADTAMLALPAPDSPPPRRRRPSSLLQSAAAAAPHSNSKPPPTVHVPSLAAACGDVGDDVITPGTTASSSSAVLSSSRSGELRGGETGGTPRGAPGDENKDPYVDRNTLQALIDSLQKTALPAAAPLLFELPDSFATAAKLHVAMDATRTPPPPPPPPLRERNQTVRPYHPPKLPAPSPPVASLHVLKDALPLHPTDVRPIKTSHHQPPSSFSRAAPAAADASAIATTSSQRTSSPHQSPTPPPQQPRRRRSPRNSYVAAHALPPPALPVSLCQSPPASPATSPAAAAAAVVPSQANPPRKAAIRKPRPHSGLTTLSPKSPRSPKLCSPTAAIAARSPSAANVKSPRHPSAGDEQLQWTTHRLHRHSLHSSPAPSSPRLPPPATAAVTSAESCADDDNPCDTSMTGLQAVTTLAYAITNRISPVAPGLTPDLAARAIATSPTAPCATLQRTDTASTEAQVEANIARALFGSVSRSASECGDATSTVSPLGEDEQAQAVLTHALASLTVHSSDPRRAASTTEVMAAEEASAAHVVRWVDYSSKYGLGYLLSDGAVGVVFNDHTTLLQQAASDSAESGGQVEYREKERERGGRDPTSASGYDSIAVANTVQRFTAAAAPAALRKKMAILAHFRSCLQNDGGGGGGVAANGDAVRLGPPVHMKCWVKTPHALVFRLSNKTIQVHFNDGTEVLLDSRARCVTYVDAAQRRSAFRLSALPHDAELLRRLKYTKGVLTKLTARDRPASAIHSSTR